MSKCGDPTPSKTIRAHVKMANDINEKIDALGMRRPPGLGADLSDLVYEHERYRQLVDELLEVDPQDAGRIAEILIGMKVWLDHMAWEARRAIRRMNRVIDYCDETADQPELETNKQVADSSQ